MGYASPVSGSARFLIVSWDGGGNAPPALNLGARLVRQGHQVRLLGWESMASRAAAAGVEFATYPSVPPWPPGAAFRGRPGGTAAACAGSVAGRGTTSSPRRTASTPDVVVVDCMMDAGLEAARDARTADCRPGPSPVLRVHVRVGR